ncbi:serine/threonine dehydratase [Streptomyces sp. G45]|uniref:serine/threonine dehydratase n=1 Tax=Streptomyces sp. G45 TaxID=3406627 RepID=UPI003C25187B
MSRIAYGDVEAAADRIAGHVRPVAMAPVEPGVFGAARGHLALEYLQHTGSFKARGSEAFFTAHLAEGSMPGAGVVIASGGNAGLATAWSGRRHEVPVTVFVPENAPAVKTARLRALGADVRQVGREYAEALAAAERFAAESGALRGHAYDHLQVAAGAGTLLPEMVAALPEGLDTVVVAVGGGGLFAGVAAAAEHFGVRVVAVEPRHCRALNAAIEADAVVDVTVESVAADSLGARRTSRMALERARRPEVRSVLVEDAHIVQARQALWDDRRIVVEHGAATALAALLSGAYQPVAGERVAVVLCGANTDPADLLPTP